MEIMPAAPTLMGTVLMIIGLMIAVVLLVGCMAASFCAGDLGLPDWTRWIAGGLVILFFVCVFVVTIHSARVGEFCEGYPQHEVCSGVWHE